MSNFDDDALKDDPFWSVVRRRHPDIDIVILPQEPGPVDESGLPARSPGAFAESEITKADDYWAQLVGHGLPVSTRRWIAGPTGDSVRFTVTLTLDGVSSTAGLGHLSEAGALLTSTDWHVFAPPTGMPRITADRSGDLGAEKILFGFAPETGRLFLRLTSTGLPVGKARSHELIGSAS